MSATHLSGPLIVAAGVTVGGNQTVTGNLAVTGNAAITGTELVTGVATFTAAPVMSALTASVPVFTDSGKALVSGTQTGTGTVVVVQGTPTLTTPVIGAATGTSLVATGILTSRSGTATPAAASSVAALTMGSAGVGIFWGTGSPNTALTAPKGSLYLRTDGSTTNDRVYVNTDASTAWTNITTAA